MTLAYLNGHYLPLDQAKIPVLDRGFLFGDAIYEVMPVYHRQLFRFEHHFQRLQRCINATQINLDYSEATWRSLLQPLIDQHPETHFNIYLQVSRGAEAKRLHQYAKDIKPTIVAFCTPHPDYTVDDFKGIHVVTHRDIRWQRCDIKSTSLLANILLQQYAMEHDAAETILIHDGHVYESTASNLFIVKDGVLITPPLSEKLLSGITRDLVIELAHKHDLPCQQRLVTLSELYQADEVWLTGSNKEIQPVLTIDNCTIAQGKIGAVWQKMIQWFFAYKQELHHG
jgi:D-alanine transaminase